MCVCVWQIPTQSPSVFIISLFDPHTFSHHRSQPSDAAFSRVPYTISAFGATLKNTQRVFVATFFCFLKTKPKVSLHKRKLSSSFQRCFQTSDKVATGDSFFHFDAKASNKPNAARQRMNDYSTTLSYGLKVAQQIYARILLSLNRLWTSL